MANCVMILGTTGTGKSTSIRTLDPKQTVVLNVLGKRLPFKGSDVMYNSAKKNFIQVHKYDELVGTLAAIAKTDYVKNVIVDDATYIMRKEFFARAKENGYGKFTDIAQHFQSVITACSALRDDQYVFLVLHAEEVKDDNGTVVGYKVSTVGKMLDNQYNPMECVDVILFAKPKYDGSSVRPEFGFYTHRVLDGKAEIPAKTPDGMFEEDFIPNDLNTVVKAMSEYYKQAEGFKQSAKTAD